MKRSHTIIGFVLLASIGYSQAAIAQVATDGTVGTIVSPGPVFNITGGTRPSNGPNLFHSFSQFSLLTGSSAIFQNDPTVQTIFSRVTGAGRSDINGLIKTQGNASLFLMNPNGILFGPNAKLELGGSFVGTTANSIKFSDGVEFSAGNLSANPLLSVRVPIGLQMGSTSGSIQVQGPGHTLVNPGSTARPTARPPQLGSLKVSSGKTLALMGNNLQLSGGILTAESGQVSLGSVGSGNIQLNTTSPQWGFSYDNISNFSDIQLTKAALIDTSGNPGGAIQLQGKTVQVKDSSALFIQTKGTQNAGKIAVQADVLELSGALPNRDRSFILSEKVGTGKGADINISVRRLLARDGGVISSVIYETGGNAGNISVNAVESIQISGFSPLSPVNTTGLNAVTVSGGGKGGNISITTPDLQVKDGARIFAGVYGGAGGGNIHIVADLVSVAGENVAISGNTVISSSSFFGGDGGSVDIDTGRLFLRASGVIAASTTGNGNAGNLSIRARELIEVDGSGSVSAQRSRITTSAQLFPLILRQSLGIPGLPTGNGGNLNITVPSLQIRNQGFIAAENTGSGDAGRLVIDANSIVLDQKGQIRTATQVGQGGLLSLTVRDALLLRHNSLISAKAGGAGNGGNIKIDSPIILGLENSDIIANASKGRGGNINITTQGLLGLKYRSRLTPDNDITASSEFGINGNVQVNTIGINPANALNALPTDIVDSSRQIADRCAAAQTSSFISTGRGGIPKNPSQSNKAGRSWKDLRDTRTDRSATISVILPIAQVQLVEASALKTNSDGSIELIAPMPNEIDSGATCALQS